VGNRDAGGYGEGGGQTTPKALGGGSATLMDQRRRPQGQLLLHPHPKLS
jgi:hypothetical protein